MNAWTQEIRQKREQYRIDHKLPKLSEYGIAKGHNPKSLEIYDFISETDFANGDVFCFKKGGDGDNGEMLLDLLDAFFQRKQEQKKQNTEELVHGESLNELSTLRESVIDEFAETLRRICEFRTVRVHPEEGILLYNEDNERRNLIDDAVLQMKGKMDPPKRHFF